MVENQMKLTIFKERAQAMLAHPARIMLVLTGLFALAALFFALRPARELRLETLPPPSAEVLLVDLNRADASALQELPGIGPELAERIVLDRTQNGPYTAAADLARVEGIGEKTVERLAQYVTVSDPKEENP